MDVSITSTNPINSNGAHPNNHNGRASLYYSNITNSSMIDMPPIVQSFIVIIVEKENYVKQMNILSLRRPKKRKTETKTNKNKKRKKRALKPMDFDEEKYTETMTEIIGKNGRTKQ